MRPVISLIAIKNNSLLLVKKKNVWILPGGKPEEGESELQCLNREMKEELPGLRVKNLKRYKSFTGIAPHKGDKIEVIVYFGDVSGDIRSEAELNDSAWVNDIKNLNVSDTTESIFRNLKKEGLIK